jgi:hypothetical protein
MRIIELEPTDRIMPRSSSQKSGHENQKTDLGLGFAHPRPEQTAKAKISDSLTIMQHQLVKIG